MNQTIQVTLKGKLCRTEDLEFHRFFLANTEGKLVEVELEESKKYQNQLLNKVGQQVTLHGKLKFYGNKVKLILPKP